MKRFLAFALLAVSSAFAHAQTATLLWTASPSANVTNYTVYGMPLPTASLTFSNRLNSVLKVSVGTNLSSVISGITIVPFQFAVTATAFGFESDLSNVLIVARPLPPTDVRLGP